MNEYKARMIASPKSKKVLDTIFRAALDDQHKNQAAAWKLVMDRVAPVALFEEDIKKAKAGGGIHISISGVGQVSVAEDPVDADYEEVTDDGYDTETEAE